MPKCTSACPFCGAHDVDLSKAIDKNRLGYQCVCNGCGARGPVYTTTVEAESGWDLGVRKDEVRYRTHDPSSGSAGDLRP